MKFELQHPKRVLTGGTLIVAATIGILMQAFGSAPSMKSRVELVETLEVEEITLTSSAFVGLSRTQRLPSDPTEGPLAKTIPATQRVGPAPDKEILSRSARDCDVSLTSHENSGAMVGLELSARCLPNERFVLHHHGMMFSARTDADGRASLTVPALAERAVFLVSFKTGQTVTTSQDVADLKDYDRVLLQWRGEAGLGLHAREFGAEYFSEGHVHIDAKGAFSDLESGHGGVLQRFGSETGAQALFAEVYTFPASKATNAGVINLSVEAEVTPRNCNLDVEAQTLQVSNAGKPKVRDVTLYMPKCDALGDFLVLKNLVEDMTLAAR